MLTIRHFWRGVDVALPRTWPFHDEMATRADLNYHLHVIGTRPERPYVSGPEFWRRRKGPEVWIVRSWDHPLITTAAMVAHLRGIPLLMWGERPGFTYEARTVRDAACILLRKALLPILFLPYRQRTLMLGTGERAVADFRALTGNARTRSLAYPDHVADACLGLPLRPPTTPPLLLYVGSFIRRKAIDLMIEACESAWKDGASFRIRYVGDGPLRSEIERSDGNVEVFPFATGSALQEHYQEADGVILASRHDGWGLTVHEGLARGVPVLVSDACGSADLVRQSGCGRVFPAGDVEALTDVLRWWSTLRPTEHNAMGANGRTLASTLTVPMLADELVSLCREAVNG